MSTTLSQLEFSILSVLLEKERYGLEIVTAIKTRRRQADPLTRLAVHHLAAPGEKGLRHVPLGRNDAPRAGARRRYYRLTALGTETLTQTQRAVANLLGLARPSEA